MLLGSWDFADDFSRLVSFMKMLPHFLRLLSLMIAMGGFGDNFGRAQTPVVSAEAIRKFTFPSEPGKAYQFEGASASGDATAWQELAGVEFGTGEPLNFEIKTSAASALTHFHLREIDPASVGIAPVQLPRGTLSLVKGGQADQMVLMSPTQGVCHPVMQEPFAMDWMYEKTGPNEGKWKATLTSGGVAVVALYFCSASTGRFVRTVPVAGHPPFVDGGIFAVSDRLVWQGDDNGRVPTDVVGRKFTFQFSGQPLQYEFGAANVERRIGVGAGLDLPYVYEPETANMGVLHITKSPSREERLTLWAKSETSGSVMREVVENGIVKDARFGTFSHPAEAAPPTNPLLSCSAPLSLVGKLFDFSNTTSGVVTMEYGNNGEGTKSNLEGGSIQQSVFTFAYTKIDDRTGRILSVFPVLDGTQIDETILHFSEDDDCSGTWERHSSRNGEPLPPSSGNFGPGNPPPS